MMCNLVSLILVLFCVSFVVAQFQKGCFQVDLSSYDTSEACVGVPRSTNFPTQTCDYQNPVLLNGTFGRCSNLFYNAIRDAVQQNCPAINYTEAYFCGDPPSELQSLPAFRYFSVYFSYCLLRSCADNSTCNPPPPPPTAPTPPPPPPLCYDCCLFCYSGNETACQNSPGYNTTFRTRDADQTGCLSCSTAPPPQSTPPLSTPGTTSPNSSPYVVPVPTVPPSPPPTPIPVPSPPPIPSTPPPPPTTPTSTPPTTTSPSTPPNFQLPPSRLASESVSLFVVTSSWIVVTSLIFVFSFV